MRLVRALLPLLMLGSALLADDQKPAPRDLQASAQQFVNTLAREDFAAAESQFDATMKTDLPEDKLRSAWQDVLRQVGKFQKITGVRVEKSRQPIIFVTAAFEQAAVDVKVVYDSEGLVSGLFFLPAASGRPTDYESPPYANLDKFDEREITLGSAPWVLHGTLTMPKGKGPFPAVVLLHGSGPQNRNETIGPNKPFRDLAEGLASRDIAVLRYDKRTLVYAAEMAKLPNVTVEQETLEDARAAIALLTNTPGIRSDRIFVLGHSLGGYLAPRLAQSDPSVRGIILFAASSRPLEDMIVQQTGYLLKQRGASPEEIKKKVDAAQQETNRVKAIQPGDTGTYFGIPASYWLDLRNYDPVATAKALAIPILMLQGERDYQVTTSEDLLRWRLLLDPHRNVTVHVYTNLNHLFEEGKGPSTPAEYSQPGDVAEYVIGDIAGWIINQNKRN
jgi:dienelactone hydrolase